MARPLPNYLRAHRKRSGFSQNDLAFLLGCRRETKVTRYERFARQPRLQTAFACAIIFRVPPEALFAGAHTEATELVLRQARALLKIVMAHAESPARGRKLALLRSVVNTLGGVKKHTVDV